MNSFLPTLSSPCGYYGEDILQALRSPIGSVLAKEQWPVRSHFDGIQVRSDGSTWHCEARVLLPAVFESPTIWLPFAKLDLPFATPGDPFTSTSKIPTLRAKPHESPGNHHSLAEAVAEVRRLLKEEEDRSDDAVAWMRKRLPWFVPALRPTDERYLKPICSPATQQSMHEWMIRNRQRLLELDYEGLDSLLTDLADVIVDSFNQQQRDDPDGSRSLNGVVLQCAEPIIFLARVFRLHWYIGHGSWRLAEQQVGGGYPRTSPPSAGWMQHVLGLFPWKRHPPDPHELIAFTRAWKWPWLYRRLMSTDAEFDRLSLFQFGRLSEDLVTPIQRLAIGSLGEWWTMNLNDRYADLRSTDIGALCEAARGKEATSRNEHGLLYGFSDLIDEHADFELSRTEHECARSIAEEWQQRQRAYFKLLRDQFQPEESYPVAFPPTGSELTLDDLFNRTQIGFVLRDYEAEIEDVAWKRFVLNEVFEDAHGPRAIARVVTAKVQERYYRSFGAEALVTRFTRDSHSIQKMLHEFVKKAIVKWHGQRWYDDGTPPDREDQPGTVTGVRQKVMSRISKSERESIAENPGLFFKQLDLLDYEKILKHEPNWNRFCGFLEKTGFEMPDPKSFKTEFGIDAWSKARNAAAHPEKADELRPESLSELEKRHAYVINWLLMIEASPGQVQSGS